MKYLTSILTILIISSLSFSNVNGQSDAALAYVPIEANATTDIEREPVKNIDAQGVDEIRKQILSSLYYPIESMYFMQEKTCRISVKLDAEGHILHAFIMDNDNDAFDKEIAKTLSSLRQVTPVRVNGKTKAYTIIVPVHFKL